MKAVWHVKWPFNFITALQKAIINSKEVNLAQQIDVSCTNFSGFANQLVSNSSLNFN